ncbi:hypothetical protein BDN72DRAFT_897051 [Pluteus cervinus]|uniref:Uncharacterized protein n=1 Tax=Pluteus cervinus TaxID=181527 RepID=A0ACD3AWV4_9AGAR|nr:hypothetical protein BDN72DRAFT_897051 [Pluteus cervinus]
MNNDRAAAFQPNPATPISQDFMGNRVKATYRSSVTTPHNPSKAFQEALRVVWSLGERYRAQCKKVAADSSNEGRQFAEVKGYIEGVALNLREGGADGDASRYRLSVKTSQYVKEQELAEHLADYRVRDDLRLIIEKVEADAREKENKESRNRQEDGKADYTKNHEDQDIVQARGNKKQNNTTAESGDLGLVTGVSTSSAETIPSRKKAEGTAQSQGRKRKRRSGEVVLEGALPGHNEVEVRRRRTRKKA